MTDGIIAGHVVQNTTDDTTSVVVSVTETSLQLEDDIFVSGETYIVGPSFPYGKELTVTPFHDAKSNVSTALTNILSVLNKDTAEFRIPISSTLPNPGKKMTFSDTQMIVDTSTYTGAATGGSATLINYEVGDLVRSNTDDRYYICTSAGYSDGDDTDLAGSSDTKCSWLAYTGSADTVNTDDTVTVYDSHITTSSYDLTVAWNGVNMTVATECDVSPSSTDVYERFIESLTACDQMHVHYSAPYLQYTRSGELVSRGYIEYIATNLITVSGTSIELYFRTPEDTFTSVSTLYNSMTGDVTFSFAGNTEDDIVETMAFSSLNLNDYTEITLTYPSGLQIPAAFLPVRPDRYCPSYRSCPVPDHW